MKGVKTQIHSGCGSVVLLHEATKRSRRGHTDSKGGCGFNQRLSERRAAAVKRLLEDNYPNLVGHIVAEGYGEDEPIAPNEIQGADNPSGRALNRRVEIQFSGRKLGRDSSTSREADRRV